MLIKIIDSKSSVKVSIQLRQSQMNQVKSKVQIF